MFRETCQVTQLAGLPGVESAWNELLHSIFSGEVKKVASIHLNHWYPLVSYRLIHSRTLGTSLLDHPIN